MSCPLLFWAPFQITNRESDVPVSLALKIYGQLQSSVIRELYLLSIESLVLNTRSSLESWQHQPSTINSHCAPAREAGGSNYLGYFADGEREAEGC